jgi:hypothetical protein
MTSLDRTEYERLILQIEEALVAQAKALATSADATPTVTPRSTRRTTRSRPVNEVRAATQR